MNLTVEVSEVLDQTIGLNRKYMLRNDKKTRVRVEQLFSLETNV